MKVWIYKGDILPYKTAAEDKIAKEAAMAVGETVGPGPERRVVSAGGGRRRPAAEATPVDGAAADEVADEADARWSRRPIPSSSACSPRKRRSSAAPASTTRRRTSAGTRTDHVDAPQGQHRKQQRGRMTGIAKGGTERHLRRLRHPGPRAGLDHRTARSRPPVSR